MGRSVIIRHSPGCGEKTEQKGPALRCPTAGIDDRAPGVATAVFMIAEGEESDAAGEEDRDVENHIRLRHLLQRGCIQRIQDRMKSRERRHNAHRLPIRRFIALEIPIHRHRRQQQLRASILRTRGPSDLA